VSGPSFGGRRVAPGGLDTDGVGASARAGTESSTFGTFDSAGVRPAGARWADQLLNRTGSNMSGPIVTKRRATLGISMATEQVAGNVIGSRRAVS